MELILVSLPVVELLSRLADLSERRMGISLHLYHIMELRREN